MWRSSAFESFELELDHGAGVDAGEDSDRLPTLPRRFVVADPLGGQRLAATEAVPAVDADRVLDPRVVLGCDQIADRGRVVDVNAVDAEPLAKKSA